MDSEESRALVQKLVASCYDPLFRYALRLGGSVPAAEDLVQETFLVALERVGQLHEPDRALAWLKTTLRNLFLAGLRRHRRECSEAEPELLAVAAPELADQAGLLDLPDALNRLSPEFRVVVIMFYGEGASYREIAQALEIPEGTVMSRLARARSALRDWLEPETRVAASNGNVS
jgi:RNA polymerase sigma-70 factor, ECF subfamily